MTSWRALGLALVAIAALGLYGCEDDPILPPGESEPDDGGSYGQMRLDVETIFGDSARSDSTAAPVSRESAREANPRLF